MNGSDRGHDQFLSRASHHVAAYLAMDETVEHMRNGLGSRLIEAETNRHFHQNRPFPGSGIPIGTAQRFPRTAPRSTMKRGGSMIEPKYWGWPAT